MVEEEVVVVEEGEGLEVIQVRMFVKLYCCKNSADM